MGTERSVERIENAAWRATRWLFQTGRRYGLHETMSALMHLRLCRTLHPRHAYLEQQRAEAPRWLAPRMLARVLTCAPLPRTLHISTHLIVLDLLAELGLAASDANRRTLVEQTRVSAERALPKIRRFSTAAELWIVAYALSCHGIELRTERLVRLGRGLPAVSERTNPWTWPSIHAFNYCTHFVLYRTRYLHNADVRLRRTPAVRWLTRFFRDTEMRDDIEYASQCLNSLSAAGAPLTRAEHRDTLLRIVAAQTKTGCFRGDAGTGRYDRFHVAWCAADALHAGARRLRSRH